MSKAFANDDSGDDEADLIPVDLLPAGTPNYMLPSGFAALETERNNALTEKRSLYASLVEHQVRLKRLERRIDYLTNRLNTANIIDPAAQPRDRVLFGALVTVKNTKGQEHTWRIVGVDEADLDKGWISWISPLARALFDKKVDDSAAIGDNRWQIQDISYPPKSL